MDNAIKVPVYKEDIMENLRRSLEGLGFSALEVNIYLILLDNGAMSPYQISKNVDISRSSIYNALEHMLNKGMVEVIPEDTVMYVAKEPEVLLNKVELDYKKNISGAKDGLKNYLETRYEDKIAVIKGYDNIICKVKNIIDNANEEVFINTNIELDVFEDEFRQAVERNVRIIVFSFVTTHSAIQEVEVYSHERERTVKNSDSRIMIVADENLVLIADADNARGNWSGTVSNNKLMKDVIREHIHNDIYMLKLRDIYGKEMYEKININTSQETKKF